METSNKIAEKASELFLKYGFRTVSMDDIAVHLGIAKKTIYKFFENKNALVESFIEKETLENSNNCNVLISQSNNSIVELFFIMVYAQRLYLRFNFSMIHDLERNHHSAYLLLKQHKNEFMFQSIKTSIEKGIKQQLYQHNFKVDKMAKFFLESLKIISDNNIFSSIGNDSTDSSKDIIGRLISGIATPSGLDIINNYKSQHRFTLDVEQILNQPYWED